MISFYPGPSKIFPEIKAYMEQAFEAGILSVNHRSPEFVSLSQDTLHILKEKLKIPEDFQVFFNSSATESWEIIAQSLIANKSFHIFNGAFGEKWHTYTAKLKPADKSSFSIEETINPDFLRTDADLIAITQNETSNGTSVSNETIAQIKNSFPDKLVAVDATSSMGGTFLDFSAADIWFASVQKCFGLPAGMGLMICSPQAINRAEVLNEKMHYNSLLLLNEQMRSFQTSYTPNVLSIFLLNKVLYHSKPIELIDERLNQSIQKIYAFFQDKINFKPLVKTPALRSNTIVCIEGEAPLIEKVKKEAKEAGLLLGNGYGNWAKTTFRIANFPAHTQQDFQLLLNFLKDY